MVGVSEWIAWVIVLLLALYGCAQAIRRLCLWATRCDKTVCFYRLAVPRSMRSLEPLMRCLQAQTAWGETTCNRTLVLLPPLSDEERQIADRLMQEDPSVIPMTEKEMITLLSVLRD